MGTLISGAAMISMSSTSSINPYDFAILLFEIYCLPPHFGHMTIVSVEGFHPAFMRSLKVNL